MCPAFCDAMLLACVVTPVWKALPFFLPFVCQTHFFCSCFLRDAFRDCSFRMHLPWAYARAGLDLGVSPPLNSLSTSLFLCVTWRQRQHLSENPACPEHPGSVCWMNRHRSFWRLEPHVYNWSSWFQRVLRECYWLKKVEVPLKQILCMWSSY